MNSRELQIKVGKEITLNYGKALPARDRISGEYSIVGSNGIVGKHNNFLIEGPGVVVGRKGSVGALTWLENNFWPIDTTYYVTLNNEGDLNYWYYQLQCLKLDSLNSHAAVPGLNREDVYRIEVSKRSIDDQRKIAKILRDLDRKIELNGRMNETLEQIGQALFKEYFVDNSELDEGKIGDLIIQTSEKVGNVDQEEFVVLSAVKTGNLVKSEDYFTKQVFSKDISKYKKLKKFDFAYNPARVNIGSVGMLEENFFAVVSPVYVTFRTLNNQHFFIKQLLKLESTKSRIIELCSGSVRQALRFDDFARIKIKRPTDRLIEKFNNEYSVFYDAAEKNQKQTETLIEIRDQLLPRLLTGEIKI